MGTEFEKARRAAEYIKEKLVSEPEIGVILGSGLGSFSNELVDSQEISYKDIPGFSELTVVGHEGKFVCGRIQNKTVIVMKGRFHYYEGFGVLQVVLPVRVMKLLGVKKLVITNAAGGINREFKPGDLMLITDHISFFAPSPLKGENEDSFGNRFPDMSKVYSQELSDVARSSAEALGITLKEGVYAFAQGPMYETPAEIRALNALGADAVGMSTVPEAIAAVHAGLKLLGISCITNMASGILNKQLSHDEVITTAAKVQEKFSKLLKEILKKI